jgi:hypothetical protein
VMVGGGEGAAGLHGSYLFASPLEWVRPWQARSGMASLGLQCDGWIAARDAFQVASVSCGLRECYAPGHHRRC